jgi:Cd2+/Zn2+-exporting ATPase
MSGWMHRAAIPGASATINTTMIKKHVLEIGLVLPGVPDQRDACVARLIELLQAQGLDSAHVVQQNGTAQLCLHFDPLRFSLQQVRTMALPAGAKLDRRYRHELVRLGGMDCTICATVIEHALMRHGGVLEAAVSYAAETMRLEYDTEKARPASTKA